MKASVVVITYNRLKMLRQCVESILANTGDVDYELIVWDNASTDGTGEYLDELAKGNPPLQPIHHSENVGLNGVALGVERARGAYIVDMDDDVVEVPKGWLGEMIRAFEQVPKAGYLAANVVQDEHTGGAKGPDDMYVTVDHGAGVVIEHGPTGGWCTITSREVLDAIGGFTKAPGRIFFSEDGEFAQRCMRNGLHVGIVRDLVVRHLAGVEMNRQYGYLDICKLKYSDPGYEPWLNETLEAMNKGTSGA